MNNEINYTQFKQLLIILSQYIICKESIDYTISDCYYIFIQRLIPNLNNNNNDYLTTKYKPLIKYINQQIKSGTINNYRIPPGLKLITKTRIKRKYKIPEPMINLFTDTYRIIIEVLNDLLNEILNIGFLESYLEIENYLDIEIEPGNIKPWSNKIQILHYHKQYH